MNGMPDHPGPANPPRVRRSSTGRLIRLCLKELREILRDRRTIFTLVLMPLLLYPLLSIAFYKYLLSTAETANRIQLLIGVETPAAHAELERYLEFAGSMPDRQQLAAQTPVGSPPTANRGPMPNQAPGANQAPGPTYAPNISQPPVGESPTEESPPQPDAGPPVLRSEPSPTDAERDPPQPTPPQPSPTEEPPSPRSDDEATALMPGFPSGSGSGRRFAFPPSGSLFFTSVTPQADGESTPGAPAPQTSGETDARGVAPGSDGRAPDSSQPDSSETASPGPDSQESGRDPALTAQPGPGEFNSGQPNAGQPNSGQTGPSFGQPGLRPPGAGQPNPGQQSSPGLSPEVEADPDKPQILVVPNLKQAVAEGRVDLGVIVRPQDDTQPPNGFRPILCELIYRKQSPLGFEALNYVEGRLERLNDIYVHRLLHDRLVRFHLARRGLKAELPAQLTREEVPGREGAPFSIGTLIPLILILMTVTGAVYPAIDLTAGERERGTMEALMATPVPRMGLLAAKYVAVLTVAMLTAAVNLLAMGVTLWATGVADQAFGPAGMTWGLAGQTFALLLLFAAFFSAILVALTSFARSFKEAQAYLIPIMLLALAPGVLSLMPGLRFNGVLAITPLVNIVLLARDLFQGQADPVLATAAFLSTSFYALAAIALAAHIFGTDAILYGSHASWSDLLRPPVRSRQSASVAEAMFCLAIVFPVYFVVSNVLARSQGWWPLPVKFALYAVATAAVFGLLPLALVKLQRLRSRPAFQLRGAHPGAFLGAAALGLSLWPIAHEIFLLNQWLGLVTLNNTVFESARAELARWQGVSPILILIALGVAPAVCEELLFRGYVFGAMRNAMRPATAILFSGVLFGAFHVVTSVLAIERFLPSAFLGMVLGWICWRTGSVFPGMVLHACHNGLLLLIAYYRDQLADRGWGIAEQSHMPVQWLATAVGTIGIAAGLILLTTRNRRGTVAKAPKVVT